MIVILGFVGFLVGALEGDFVGFFVGREEGFELGRALGDIVGKAGIINVIVHFVRSIHLFSCLLTVSTFLVEISEEEKSEDINDA